MNQTHLTFGFIGLGLIGGSLAINFKKIDPECRVMAYTRTHATTVSAQESGIIDTICSGPEDPQFGLCDFIFLCAPIGSNIDALPKLKPNLSNRCILTDVGSVKSNIQDSVYANGLEKQFIGGHPMTGSEKSGLANATDHLFENAYFILAPTAEVPQDFIDRYYNLVEALKAIPLVLSAGEHDFITAAISHLPHVIAAALVNTVHHLDDSSEHMKMIAAGGFKDITRIASSSPEMWEHICVYNKENIARVMDEFLRLMAEARDHMYSGDGAYINKMFFESRNYRDSFALRNGATKGQTHRIYCDIIDESGAIATIATTLAVNGISIKNIGIINNREFEEGVLSVEFYDEESAKKSAVILRSHGHKIWEIH